LCDSLSETKKNYTGGEGLREKVAKRDIEQQVFSPLVPRAAAAVLRFILNTSAGKKVEQI
jgi:hypothetical protein